MDISIGKITLTQNQVAHLADVKSGHIRGLKYTDNEVVLNAVSDLDQSEIDQIKTLILAVPDTPIVDPKKKSIRDANNLNELKAALIDFLGV